MDPSIASYVKEFGAVIDGNCVDQGYPIFDHTEQVDAGPFGKLNVDIYKKTNSEAFLQ